MRELICFTAVEFPDDPNVAGLKYWYCCPFEYVREGDSVVAPLGRHNQLQRGVVREVRFEKEYNAPYPLYLIKYIKEVVKADKGDNSDV